MSQSESEGEKTELISMHVTPEQKREIRVAAAKQDMSISAYLREQLFG